MEKKKIKVRPAKKNKGKDPCWEGYAMVGLKLKNGKMVPNCVKQKEVK